MLHVFIDESGDPGFKLGEGSTQYFLMGFAYFPSQNYKDSIDLIKGDIKSKTGRSPKEIKFNKSSHEMRMLLLQLLVENNGQFGYIYVNKMKIYEYLRGHPEINYIYNQMIFYLIENLIEQEQVRDHITLYIDQRSKNKDIKKNISTYLKRQIDPILSPYRLYARFEKSHNSRGVQCADCICGSIRRMIEENDHKYFEVIKGNIIIRRELFRTNSYEI
jgi:hypothetical protein